MQIRANYWRRRNLLQTGPATDCQCTVGVLAFGVTVVDCVITLVQNESVRLDRDRIGALYGQMGESAAEDILGRAIEELAARLTQCERRWRQRDWTGMRKSARSLVAISDQIGMSVLADVARDVTNALDCDDHVAVSATLFRLIRIGERSLTAVWDLRDLSL